MKLKSGMIVVCRDGQSHGPIIESSSQSFPFKCSTPHCTISWLENGSQFGFHESGGDVIRCCYPLPIGCDRALLDGEFELFLRNDSVIQKCRFDSDSHTFRARVSGCDYEWTNEGELVYIGPPAEYLAQFAIEQIWLPVREGTTQ